MAVAHITPYNASLINRQHNKKHLLNIHIKRSAGSPGQYAARRSANKVEIN